MGRIHLSAEYREKDKTVDDDPDSDPDREFFCPHLQGH